VKNAPQGIRIIGGEWRGRRLQVPDLDGLRPTQDRFRETLFNWLMFQLSGKRVLDLFAGSGALGLEALSRGADSAVFVEKDPRAATGIREFLGKAGCSSAEVITADARAWLSRPAGKAFDVVFLDPPFRAGLLPGIMAPLETSGCLAADAWIYLESEPELDASSIPAAWAAHREIRQGSKWMQLRRRNGASA
jgi:16S rRNA (guanine966-N2)-methyltransferase